MLNIAVASHPRPSAGQVWPFLCGCVLLAFGALLLVPDLVLIEQRLALPPPNINALRWFFPAAMPTVPEDPHGI